MSHSSSTTTSQQDWQLTTTNGQSVGLSLSQLKADCGLVLGRSANVSDVILNESNLSKRHIRLQWQANQLWLEDLYSLNGSIVNGQTLTPYQEITVQSGDTLILADIEMTLEQII